MVTITDFCPYLLIWALRALTTGFCGNFIAGVVSALAVLLGQLLYRKNRDKETFSPMEGDYEELERKENNTLASTGGTIKLRHIREDIFTTEAWTSAKRLEWTGIIRMNAQVPNVGDGAYFYADALNCGTHHVQRSGTDFVVLGINTSEPKGHKGFYMLWRHS